MRLKKAHPDVWNVLLQVLDDGRLTDNKGRVVNFKNTIIIMTSNIGSHLIQDAFDGVNENNIEEANAKAKLDVMNLLRQTIRPEFLNRVDEIIMFQPLLKKRDSRHCENTVEQPAETGSRQWHTISVQ